MDKRTNTYLQNGHNYQDGRLRCYLPGNGGLLTAVALMCAGWDGCQVKNPGFPQDGTWDVRWEGLPPVTLPIRIIVRLLRQQEAAVRQHLKRKGIFHPSA